MLNRIVRVSEKGWEYEPDQRHAELIVESLGLTSANAVTTPGEDEKKWEETENQKPLDEEKTKRFRQIAARANYLATDRPDIMYAVKEACRHMASPTTGAWRMLKRIGRYLAGKPRTLLEYKWQGKETEVEGFSDSDWAGCRTTGKSTSAGALLIGSHFLKGWSRTQNCVTMSSAEAELVAMVKLTAEVMGVLSMAKDWGEDMKGRVFADSSAALAISNRKGSGKLRHINIGLLWIQEKEAKEDVQFEKVDGKMNPADLMTKNLGRERSEQHANRLGQRIADGRAGQGLKLQRGFKEPRILRVSVKG